MGTRADNVGELHRFQGENKQQQQEQKRSPEYENMVKRYILVASVLLGSMLAGHAHAVTAPHAGLRKLQYLGAVGSLQGLELVDNELAEMENSMDSDSSDSASSDSPSSDSAFSGSDSSRSDGIGSDDDDDGDDDGDSEGGLPAAPANIPGRPSILFAPSDSGESSDWNDWTEWSNWGS